MNTVRNARKMKVYDQISLKVYDVIVCAIDGTVMARDATMPEGVRLIKKYDAHIMHSTGVKDKKGHELFEDDVVERLCLSPRCEMVHRGIVQYDETFCMFVINVPKQEKSYPLVIGSEVAHIVPDFLGNVFENTELLKDLI